MRLMKATTRFTSEEGSFKRGDIITNVASDLRAAYLIGIHVAEDYGPAPKANKAYEPNEKKAPAPQPTTLDTGALREPGRAKPAASSEADLPSRKPKSTKPFGKRR